MPKEDLFSLRIIALSMVHLYSKSLASLKRCMCEKEVIRTACASLINRCGGAPGAQYVKRWPADLAVPGLSPSDGGSYNVTGYRLGI